MLLVGVTVTWTYEVTAAGGRDLFNVTVTDDQGVAVTCPSMTVLAGETMICTASDTVQAGQYANLGTVNAELVNGTPVSATDPSHYFGQAQIVLVLEKRTEGEDADTPPGPFLPVGATVNWEYEVTNTGTDPLTDVSVSDDQGVVVTCPGTTLAPGASMTCTASGVVQPGQYANVGSAEATLPSEEPAAAADLSHYFGQSLRLEKATNGQDADLPPGPVLTVGDPVSWTYVVTNPGPAAVSGVAVTDDQGVAVNCPQTTLAADESVTCAGNGTVAPGQYANVGTATALLPAGGEVSASEPSHYFGQDQDRDFGDAPVPSYPTLLAANGARHVLGSGVYLGACVDSEPDGQPTATADGDDSGAGLPTFGICAVPGDDEDGAAFTTALTIGTTAGVNVIANQPCTLTAWIDFNADGDWSDAGEDLFPGGTALAAGSNSLAFAVPAGAAPGATAARFRCTSAGAVTFVGEAADGEVEDYAVTIEPPPAPALSATKTAALAVDVDADGAADPGDTLAYTVTLLNSGAGPATGVAFTDTPDPNTALVVGSVVTTQGAVTSGNGAGDTSVAVAVGTLAAGGGSATITFQVTIDNPLPPGVQQVANQGFAAADNAAAVPTDDPAAPGAADPTVVAVSAASLLEIPAAGAWGLAAMALLLAALGVRRLLAA